MNGRKYYKTVRELFEDNYREDPVYVSKISDGTVWEDEG